MSNPFKIVAKENAATVWLYDEIGPWGVTAKMFADELKAAGNIQRINVQINSPGGDVFDGLAIYNALVKHAATVDVEIDGYAASIASIIAMAGDTIRIADNAMMMIHNPWTIAMGEASDFRKTADTLDQVRDQLIKTYAKRTGQSAEALGQMMDAETWLESGPAVEQGFADEVLGEQRLAASAMKAEFHKEPPKNWEPASTVYAPKRELARQSLKTRFSMARPDTPKLTDDGAGLVVEVG